MLPMTVLRRLDCVLDPTKPQILETQKKWGGKAADALLRKAARQSFYNTSKLDFERLKSDSNNIAPNLLKYSRSFSPNVRNAGDSKMVELLHLFAESGLAGISHRSLRAVTWRGHSCLPGCPLGRALLPTLPSTQCHSRAHVSR